MEFKSVRDLKLTFRPTQPWKLPSWSTFGGSRTRYGQICTANYGFTLIGYAIFGPREWAGFPEVLEAGVLEMNPDVRKLTPCGVCTEGSTRGVLELKYLEVIPSHQNQGIGSYLLRQIISYHPNKSIMLDSVNDGDTYRFYDRHDFVVFCVDYSNELVTLVRPAPGVDTDALKTTLRGVG